MKLIKYRAWDKEEGKFVSFQFVGNNDDGYGAINSETGRQVELQEFTGLKDKNGKEIYEGDILKDTFAQVHEIRWVQEEGNLKAVFRDGSDYDQYRHFKDIRVMEVIGNIYEMPELLSPSA
jgi:uncharacterized phage protein (TIGR01671 family)